MGHVELGDNLIRPDPRFEIPPYSHRDAYMAPLRRDADGNPVGQDIRPWEGIAARKPWHYRVVAGIVHIDQPEMLECVIETLRLQTERPFIHVVDTGSNRSVIEKLDRMELESDDLRIDHLHCRGYSQTSVPVACAMDLIFASVDYGVEYCYSTHVDVFLKSRKYIAYLVSKCNAMTPVVGYRMSPRKMTDLWRIIPSHTASLYHMPTMRKIRAQWSMHAAAERLGLSPEVFRNVGGWPDTETNLGLILQDAGIGMRSIGNERCHANTPSWLCIGDEANERYETPWLIHERSATSQALYAREYAEKRKDQIAKTLEETWSRIAMWKDGVIE